VASKTVIIAVEIAFVTTFDIVLDIQSTSVFVREGTVFATTSLAVLVTTSVIAIFIETRV
jgi:hypothetical protein